MGNLKMKNRTIVITGSNGSTARELIRYFSKSFDEAIGISRDPHETFTEKNINIYTANMLNHAESMSVARQIIENHQIIDVWVNCIGGFSMGSSIDEDDENWNSMYNINFLTCLNGCKVALHHMKHQKHGKIINIGSKAALDGFPNAAAYLISKSSVHTLTKLIALETADLDITCNAILPGIIDTTQNREAMPNEDFTKWETPKQIASTINETLHSTDTGQLISVNI